MAETSFGLGRSTCTWDPMPDKVYSLSADDVYIRQNPRFWPCSSWKM